MQDFTSLLTRGGGYLSPFTPYPDAGRRNDPENAKKSVHSIISNAMHR